MHMFWRCPKLLRYWKEVSAIIGQVFGGPLDWDVRLCELGFVEGEGNPGCTQVAILRCLFQARKLIAQRWQSVLPPSSREWESDMNETIWKEKSVYVRQNSIKKYEEIWKPWWDVKGYLP